MVPPTVTERTTLLSEPKGTQLTTESKQTVVTSTVSTPTSQVATPNTNPTTVESKPEVVPPTTYRPLPKPRPAPRTEHKPVDLKPRLASPTETKPPPLVPPKQPTFSSPVDMLFSQVSDDGRDMLNPITLSRLPAAELSPRHTSTPEASPVVSPVQVNKHGSNTATHVLS